jgi:hypothetical protein
MPTNYSDTNHLTATATLAIAEQLADITEANHPHTIRAEQDAERDALWAFELGGEEAGYSEFLKYYCA